MVSSGFIAHQVGYRNVCADLAERLRGERMRVITTSAQTGRVARVADMLITAWKHRREYAVAQIDVFSGAAFVWAEAVARLLGWLRKPIILTLHGGNLPEFAAQHPERVRRLLRSAAVVTTPSGYLCERLKAYRDDIAIIPNPIELDKYVYRLRERPAPKLIWLRAFHAVYQPEMALRVASMLCGDYPVLELVMIGPDKGDGTLQRVEAMVREMGLERQVKIIGAVAKEDVPRWLDSADILLNTTTIDNTPLSVIEAMACALCVISTNVGGVPYLVRDGVNGLLVESGDAAAMADAVRRVLSEDGMAARLSSAGREKAAGFDWSAVLPMWIGVIEGLAEASDPQRD
jgi:glycosyltransferase involved in cell wall biosynthesis